MGSGCVSCVGPIGTGYLPQANCTQALAARAGTSEWCTALLTRLHLACSLMQDMAVRQDNALPKGRPSRARVRARSKAIRKELNALGFVVSGTLHHRMKKCGRPTCKCATDPAARHGPYFEWGRMRDKKLVQQTVTPAQAKLLERGIKNHKRAQELLDEWKQLSEAEILRPDENNESRPPATSTI